MFQLQVRGSQMRGPCDSESRAALMSRFGRLAFHPQFIYRSLFVPQRGCSEMPGLDRFRSVFAAYSQRHSGELARTWRALQSLGPFLAVTSEPPPGPESDCRVPRHEIAPAVAERSSAPTRTARVPCACPLRRLLRARLPMVRRWLISAVGLHAAESAC